MTRSVRLGATLAAVYVVAAAATTSWAPGRLRPLYDGFGSHPGQYNWVNPPKEFAEGNQRPEPARAETELDAAGSKPTSAGPEDGQVLVTLDPGALAPHPPDSKATVALTPVDPGTLGPLPAGLRAEGNAYLVAIAYAPSGSKVDALAEPGRVGLISVAPAGTLLYSADGTAWDAREGDPLPTGNGLTGTLDAAGYYLAASEGAPRAVGGGGSGAGGGGTLLLLAVPIPIVLALLLMSRRRRTAPAQGRGPAGRPRSGVPGGRGTSTQSRAGTGGSTSAKAAKGGKAKGGNGAKPGTGPPTRRR